jgi:hypothetical protein
MTAWNDITSYQRGGDRTPHWWELAASGLHVKVGDRYAGLPDGNWMLTCQPWFDCFPLRAKSEAEAKQEAINLVMTKIRTIYEELASSDSGRTSESGVAPRK